MAWTESCASSNEWQRCIRALVALSTLPAAGHNYDIRQIRGSMVAALIPVLDADLVLITIPDPGNRSMTELSCNHPKPGPADLRRVRTGLQPNKQRSAAGRKLLLPAYPEAATCMS
ncbi:MAG: hypothetical protein QOH32_1129 [Bradyrhizobium sp.]|nr:hypothetical protein [Bradyrhizobium sp.]